MSYKEPRNQSTNQPTTCQTTAVVPNINECLQLPMLWPLLSFHSKKYLETSLLIISSLIQHRLQFLLPLLHPIWILPVSLGAKSKVAITVISLTPGGGCILFETLSLSF